MHTGKAHPGAAEQQRLAKLSDPGRLSTAQFDRTTEVINWPALLRDPIFRKERTTLDQLFANRTPENSGKASDNYVNIAAACEAMQKTLGEKLRKDKLPAVTFIACKHFIDSVHYEGQFAAQ